MSSMLDRYKKGSGIVDLVKLVEDAAEPKRSQLLNMIRTEDPEFAAKVEARVLNWEKIRELPEGSFAEVVGASAPKYIAMALVGETAEFVALAEKCLGKSYNEYKQEKENFAATPPNQGQIEAARRKIVSEARKLDTEGAIKILLPEAAGAGGSAPSPFGTGPAGMNNLSNGPQGLAKAEDGCPSFESFNFEAAPPGLTGERLETYLKTMLGL